MIDVEKKAQLACQLKAEGYNCAQAVFAAFAEDYGIDKATAVRLTAGLGGGVAKMKDVCGAYLGTAMLSGLEEGCVDPGNMEGKEHAYKVAKDLAMRFKEQNGSTICAELRGVKPNPDVKDIIPCSVLVERAARIYAEYLNAKKA